MGKVDSVLESADLAEDGKKSRGESLNAGLENAGRQSASQFPCLAERRSGWLSLVAASSSWRTVKSMGLVMWWSKPASFERRRSSSCPHPVFGWRSAERSTPVSFFGRKECKVWVQRWRTTSDPACKSSLPVAKFSRLAHRGETCRCLAL
jgi:hypothetical protein